jgi:hypothetical protein
MRGAIRQSRKKARYAALMFKVCGVVDGEEGDT